MESVLLLVSAANFLLSMLSIVLSIVLATVWVHTSSRRDDDRQDRARVMSPSHFEPGRGEHHWRCRVAVATALVMLPKHVDGACVETPVAHGQTCPAAAWRATCTYTPCDDGFVASGVMTCSGILTQTWSGGSCVAAHCDGSPIEHSVACHGTFGDTCEAVCDPGYEGAGDSTYTCGGTGTWTGGSYSCVGITCPAAPPKDAQHINSCPARQYGSNDATCHATCTAGYQSSKTSGSSEYECGVDGDWVGGNLICVGSPCTGLPKAGNHMTFTDTNTISPNHYPSTVKFSCRGKNSFVNGDEEWTCDATDATYRSHDGLATPSNTPSCSSCPGIDHCAAESLTCKKSKPWSKQAVSTCTSCAPGYTGGPQSGKNVHTCEPVVCKAKDAIAHGEIHYSVQGDPWTEEQPPNFSGTEERSVTLVKSSVTLLVLLVQVGAPTRAPSSVKSRGCVDIAPYVICFQPGTFCCQASAHSRTQSDNRRGGAYS
eukprot:COSAG06_NODE_1457_length_9417_cov_58.780425_6_plen_485_part_00